MSFFWSRIQFLITHCIQVLFSLITFNLREFLSLSLSFIILRWLMSNGWLFCTVSLNLGLYGIYLWLNSGYAFWARIQQKWCVLRASRQEAHDVDLSNYWWFKMSIWKYYIVCKYLYLWWKKMEVNWNIQGICSF